MAKDDGVAVLSRGFTLEIARVTEAAAVAAAGMRGRGDEEAADQAAVDAMRRELNRLPITGRVVIGEGERDEAPMLFIGEEVGTGDGPEVDIAVDPLEGTTICAKALSGALAVIAVAAYVVATGKQDEAKKAFDKVKKAAGDTYEKGKKAVEEKAR